MAISTKWCFTLNNYTEDDEKAIQEWDVKYLVYGREVAPNTGTKHLQGYSVFKKNHRLTAVKKLNGSAHWEVARGSHQQNRDYCTKDGDFFETGELPLERGASEKRRWEEARESAKKGLYDEVPADIFFKYYRTMKEIRKDFMDKPNDADDVTGIWYVGEPGVGKSRTAREQYPGAYMKMQNKWWDGYQGEEYVILDDLDSKELGHHLKIWGDRYSFLAETKGGALHIRPKKIVVTSNYYPKDLWEGQMLEAIQRRYKVVVVKKLRDHDE